MHIRKRRVKPVIEPRFDLREAITLVDTRLALTLRLNFREQLIWISNANLQAKVNFELLKFHDSPVLQFLAFDGARYALWLRRVGDCSHFVGLVEIERLERACIAIL